MATSAPTWNQAVSATGSAARRRHPARRPPSAAAGAPARRERPSETRHTTPRPARPSDPASRYQTWPVMRPRNVTQSPGEVSSEPGPPLKLLGAADAQPPRLDEGVVDEGDRHEPEDQHPGVHEAGAEPAAVGPHGHRDGDQGDRHDEGDPAVAGPEAEHEEAEPPAEAALAAGEGEEGEDRQGEQGQQEVLGHGHARRGAHPGGGDGHPGRHRGHPREAGRGCAAGACRGSGTGRRGAPG